MGSLPNFEDDMVMLNEKSEEEDSYGMNEEMEGEFRGSSLDGLDHDQILKVIEQEVEGTDNEMDLIYG